MFRGVPLPSLSLSYQWGHWIFCLGGGGGGGEYFVRVFYFEYSIFRFCYRCFDFVVLISVVYSIFSCYAYWFVLFLVLHAVVGSV